MIKCILYRIHYNEHKNTRKLSSTLFLENSTIQDVIVISVDNSEVWSAIHLTTAVCESQCDAALHVLLMKHVCGHLIWRWRFSHGGCDKRRWRGIWSAECAWLGAGRASRTLHSISATCRSKGVHQEHPVISPQKY